MSRRIIVTAALPYANGPLHLGHILEYTQADIWVRFQKMQNHECHYFCGNDSHGTPIMLNAQKENKTPENFVSHWHEDHKKQFANFEVDFTYYGNTHNKDNQKLSESFYEVMKDKKLIDKQSVEQFYCEHDKMFLPDRYMKGTCPICGASDQYGDSCEVCGSFYSSSSLKDRHCVICKNTPVLKESSGHLFFKLNEFKDFLEEWIPKHTQKEVSNKLKEWLKDLKNWNISREAPYFGFPIPGEEDKFFYVWLDAPIGYICFTKQWCESQNKNYEDYWKSKDSEVYHFIGQDLISFHLLFWPAMLKTMNYSTPNKVFVHGFLTVNGTKMSKSRGTFITAEKYLEHLEPFYLRYYLASKLSSRVEDVDLSLEDFVQKVNSEVIGKITNLCSRSAKMLSKKLDHQMTATTKEGQTLIKKFIQASEQIKKDYENIDYNKVVSQVREFAEEANRYVDEKEPWNLIKTDSELSQQILTDTLNLYRILAIYLKPILPSYVKKVEDLFNEKPYTWDSLNTCLEDHKIKSFEHLAQRIDPEVIKKLIN